MAACAQKASGKTPPTALAHLTNTYPGAAVKEWKQGAKNWKAEFKLKDEKYDAYYTPAGRLGIGTEHNIPKSELPAAVTTSLKASKYNSWKIDDVEEHATPEQ